MMLLSPGEQWICPEGQVCEVVETGAWEGGGDQVVVYRYLSTGLVRVQSLDDFLRLRKPRPIDPLAGMLLALIHEFRGLIRARSVRRKGGQHVGPMWHDGLSMGALVHLKKHCEAALRAAGYDVDKSWVGPDDQGDRSPGGGE